MASQKIRLIKSLDHKIRSVGEQNSDKNTGAEVSAFLCRLKRSIYGFEVSSCRQGFA